jgi:AhpD family alkylhydroperoxidase
MAEQKPGSWRKNLTPDIEAAWQHFSQVVFQDGTLDAKTKQLIAVAVAHVTQCQDCIRIHTQSAQRHGVTEAELLEAIWVAVEMRAGAAVSHSRHAFSALTSGHEDVTI